MEKILNISQIVIAIALMTVILLQSKGSGLGGAFGGGEGNVYRTKRGFEKILHVSTVVLSVGFIGVAMANVLLRQ